MPKVLIGRMSDLGKIKDLTRMRFKCPEDFIFPESLILDEQRLIDEDTLLSWSSSEYGRTFTKPIVNNVNNNVIQQFKDTPFVILNVTPSAGRSCITLGICPEFADEKVFDDDYEFKVVQIPLNYYCRIYLQQRGRDPEFLSPIPPKDLLQLLYAEALKERASDITLTSTRQGAEAYYMVRRRKVRSVRQFSREELAEMISLIAAGSGQQMDTTLTDSEPRYMAATLDKDNRGRVVVNRNYYGPMASIRVLHNTVLNTSLENLNLSDATCKFMRDHFISKEKGLRLLIGETASGKNTTILSALNELVQRDDSKIVSVEQPVEILVDGIEQINAETDEEFEKNADSLLRQNPDYVYFTEMTDRTSRAVMEQSNTAKAVFSTIHANSIAEVLFRLQDITKFPLDRLILTLQSCVYQELRRVEELDQVFPYDRCVYFDNDLKLQLYGKSTGEITTILRQKEEEWDRVANANWPHIRNKDIRC